LRLLLRLWILCSLGWVGTWGFEHRERLGYYARTWMDAKSNEMDRVFIASLLLGDLQKLLMQALLPMTLTLLAMMLGVWLFGSLRKRGSKDQASG
jgi:hypothetical protein